MRHVFLIFALAFISIACYSQADIIGEYPIDNYKLIRDNFLRLSKSGKYVAHICYRNEKYQVKYFCKDFVIPIKDGLDHEYYFSDDGNALAIITDSCAIIDGKIVSKGKHIEKFNFQPFSTDYMLIYSDMEKGGIKRYLKIRDTQHGPYDEIKDFSYNLSGTSYSYSYRRGNNWYISMEDTTYGPLKNVQLSMSKVGNKICYITWGQGKSRIVIDDKSYIEKGKIVDFTATDDYSHYAYKVILPMDEPNSAYYKFLVRKNQQLFGPFSYFCPNFMHINTEVFLGKEGSFICFASHEENNDEHKDGFYVHYNGQTNGGYDWISDFWSDENRSKIGFIYKIDKSWYTWICGTSFGPYEAVTPVYISPNGVDFAFKYLSKGQLYINYDGSIIFETPGEFDISFEMGNIYGETPQRIVFGEDGAVGVIYNNKGRYYLYKEKGNLGGYDWISDLKWVKGKGFCYIYKKNDGWYFHISNKDIGPYKAVTYNVGNNNGIVIAYLQGGKIIVERLN